MLIKPAMIMRACQRVRGLIDEDLIAYAVSWDVEFIAPRRREGRVVHAVDVRSGAVRRLQALEGHVLVAAVWAGADARRGMIPCPRR